MRVVVCILVTLSLSACHSFSFPSVWQTGTKETGPTPVNIAPTVVPSSGLAQCREELRSLKGLDETLWQPRQEAFSQVLSKASRYMVLRPRLSKDMQQVMDSIHQAQLARSCQEIHAALFRALLNRADNP
ncbi:hypothetical protein EWN99_21690 [Salmonella enterica]|nr:hypothetical protein [Salmonella enterica subsp. enterica serovar Manhattan]EAR6709298.1 hypothetical protein [Salmonella enterica]EBS3177237.1 hypothetical protein [Salmonella enterica subsp. enterica serovar Newport]ECI5144685.1 hypothetical protein [Salmonella enterica subsp. salamae]EAS2251012.1 hypothetical protein [Salmonella enterica]